MVLAYAEALFNQLQRPGRQIDRPSASALRELEFLRLLAAAPCDLDVAREDADDSGPATA
jgi:hypothetical protein